MAQKALILLIASIVLGAGALGVLAAAALATPPKQLDGQFSAFLWVLVGQLAVVLGIFTDRKAG